MLRRRMKCSLVLVAVILPAKLFAANLTEVFHDALASDPTYKAATSGFYATKENVPISVASFLPQLNVNGQIRRDRNDTRSGPPVALERVFLNDQANYGVRLDQSIFNFGNWASLASAKAATKQECARLNAAYQDLIIRTSRAYFDVLSAYETLRFTIAEKKSTGRLLEQNRERYKVGLIAITAVYETQASYDTSVAREIAAQNEFANAIERLREITGKKYSYLKGIRDKIPLYPPRPTNIESWVTVATKQNYSLQAAGYGVQVARENIKLAFAGHMPTVDGFAGWSYSFQSDPFGANSENVNKQANVGVNAAFPVYSGGAVSAQTRQARFLLDQACAERERVYRSTASSARQAYLAVISGISQVKANKQTIKSRISALKATEAAYEVGTRTMVDVLDAQSRLFNAQEITARTQYDFLFNTLLLEQAAGTLCPDDLDRINRYLPEPVSMISYSSIGRVERLKGPRPEDIKPTDLAHKDVKKVLSTKR